MSSASVITTAPWHRSGVVGVRPSGTSAPVIIEPSTSVVALRRADPVPLGGSAFAPLFSSGRLVASIDIDGTPWWIPADAVWTDAATSVRPERLQPCGLAIGSSTSQAMVLGVSDYFGRDALFRMERGDDLPVLTTPAGWHNTIVLDGRALADVPTVVVLGEQGVRWGAGLTWERALDRAIYGKTPDEGTQHELRDLLARLADVGHTVVGADVGSDALHRAAITRLSVQVVTPHDGLGR